MQSGRGSDLVYLRGLAGGALLGAAVIAVTLWSWGQPLVSASGDLQLWVGSIWSSENSQQVADWYTLSHVIHGLLIALAGHALGIRPGHPALLAVVFVTGIGWEIVEHTDWVLGRFREATVYQGYLGDSVLNAVCDYLFMLAGFWIGGRLGSVPLLGLVVMLEFGSAIVARDSLTLTTLQLLHPVAAIAAWQDAINPRSRDGAGPAAP